MIDHMLGVMHSKNMDLYTKGIAYSRALQEWNQTVDPNVYV